MAWEERRAWGLRCYGASIQTGRARRAIARVLCRRGPRSGEWLSGREFANERLRQRTEGLESGVSLAWPQRIFVSLRGRLRILKNELGPTKSPPRRTDGLRRSEVQIGSRAEVTLDRWSCGTLPALPGDLGPAWLQGHLH